MKKSLIFGLLPLLLATACTQKKADRGTNDGGLKPVTKPVDQSGHLKDDPSMDIETRVIRNISYNVILQTYKDMKTRTARLQDLVAQLEANPSQALLEQAQQAWRDCRQAWEGTESFLFGPVESLGIDPMIDTWPLNITDMDALIQSSLPLTPDRIRGLGTNVQGFHTVEYLLFGNGVNGNTRDITKASPRELQYLTSTATLLAAAAANLETSWEKNHDPDDPSAPGYVDMIMNPGLNNKFYATKISVLMEFANGMKGIVDEVGNGKIADPMGGDISHADPSKVESPFSWNSIADFMNNIRSVQAVYSGTYDGHTGPGLKDVIARQDAVLAETLDAQISLSIQKISDISGPDRSMPFRFAISNPEGRQRVQAAVDELHKLLNLINTKMIPLLSK